MGENRRYGFQQVDPAIKDLITRPRPISLTSAEVGADTTYILEAKDPPKVIAWVRYPEAAVQVKARAVRGQIAPCGWSSQPIPARHIARGYGRLLSPGRDRE